MIIPVRCMTCGKTLADKYDWYVREAEKLAKEAREQTKKTAAATAPAPDAAQGGGDGAAASMRHFDAVHTGAILDRLGLTRPCCRRDMMATVDMMELI